ncbi:MAG: hypothetical protein M1343_00915 [Chloroflexi bacterium]|nr:hypothetical protein [Chloroflexota bacterium]
MTFQIRFDVSEFPDKCVWKYSLTDRPSYDKLMEVDNPGKNMNRFAEQTQYRQFLII